MDDPIVEDPDVIEEDVSEQVTVLEAEQDIGAEVQSSVQIAPTGAVMEAAAEAMEEPDLSLFIQLGDHLVIQSKYGQTVGTVYYRSEELIRIKPDGVSNRLYDFPITRTEEEELFDEDDQVTGVFIAEKRKTDAFVAQQDFRVGQIIDTYDASGDLYKSYKVIAVNRNEDTLTVQDNEDPETEETIEFNWVGIPTDLPFTVMTIRIFSEKAEEQENLPEEATVSEETPLIQEDTESEIQVIGMVRITRPRIFKEAESHEQRIPENLQKMDAFNDFVNSLDSSLQKDPNVIRSMRILVETLYQLKQETISYYPDGNVEGPKEVSATMISSLLEKTSVPLGRPVLDVTKKLYSYTSPEEAEEQGQEEETKLPEEVEESDETRMVDFMNDLAAMNTLDSKIVSSQGGSVQMYWMYLQALLRDYMTPWSPTAVVPPYWGAKEDTEFFRKQAPSVVEMSRDKYELLPAVQGYLPSHSEKRGPYLHQIPFGLERALAPTYRKGADRSKQLLLREDGASLSAYLLFPLRMAAYLGKKRTSSLAEDSGRSHLPPKTLRMILEEIGGPKEIGATANDLVIMGVQGTTLGNIPLADYIQGLTIPALGLGDTFSTLEHYGMTDVELNKPIATVLQAKIEKYQSQLISTLSRMRSELEKMEKPAPEIRSMLPQPAFLETLLSQPILKEALEEYARANPSLANFDLGKVAYLQKRMENFFQVTAGKQSLLISKALVEETNLRFIRQLQIESLLKYNQEHGAPPPRRNRCTHVADMVSVRRLRDDTERFHAFSLVFRKYQGVRTDNWIDCNVCKEHLACIHERLQMHAFLHPKEKAVIEKEILLKCSGGMFQGSYICRNCGQPLRELDFDQNVEFDDNGRPKYGVNVLRDEDAEFAEKLDDLTGAPTEPSEIKQMGLNEAQQRCYQIARELSEKVGIQLDQKSYYSIIDRVLNHMSKFPSAAQYIAEQLARARKAGGKKGPDYEVARSRMYICSVAASLLLDIQMKVPSYTIRYVMVGSRSPGFGGYPLEKTETNMQGIAYIAFAVSMVESTDPLWANTRFLMERQKDAERAQNAIQGMIYSLINEFTLSDPLIPAGLGRKREYLTEVMGSESEDYGKRLRDSIPPTFLPEPMLIRPEDAAKDVITPEIAESMGKNGQMALVKLWIRQSHRLAKETSLLIRGSPYSEMTCCAAPIQTPAAFWKSREDLPRIGSRALVPNQQGQFLVTEFVPRPMNIVVAEPDKSLYHRVFLKCCFTGPFEGYPHEPGLTNRCIRCGFQFPSHPLIMNSDEEGRAALETQEVKVDTDSFTELLDKIHRVNEVTPEEAKRIRTMEESIGRFGAVMPPPLPGWTDLIGETIQALKRLPADATQEDVAMELRDLAEQSGEAWSLLRTRLSIQKYQERMEEITSLSWTNFFQVLQTHFITPFQRLLSGYSENALFVPYELTRELADDHVRALNVILSRELSLFMEKKDDIQREVYEMVRVKMAYALKQWSALLPFKELLREKIIPGRKITMAYFQRAMFYGPLSTMIDPNQLPPGVDVVSSAASGSGDSSTLFMLRLLTGILDKYAKERLSFNDQQLRNEIAVREEKERVSFIKKFDRLSDEMKRVELMKKQYGLGDWSVGGTRVIYAYDKGYYNLEMQKRMEAGVVDFPELLVDENGFRQFSDEQMEAEGGYDMDMQAGNHDDD